MNNKNYRIMKFFEPINKQDKSRGYVRLDIRGIKGNILVSVENLGDVKSTSEVYLYKDRTNKIKLGDINNKKGMLKKLLTFGSNNAIEDYNVCAVVRDKKIVLYSSLFNASNPDQIRKLEVEVDELAEESRMAEDELVEEIRMAEETEYEEAEEIAEVYEEAENIEEIGSSEEIGSPEEIASEDDADELKQEEADELNQADAEIEESDSRIKKTSVNSAVNINEVRSETSGDDNSENRAQSRRFRSKFDESLYRMLKEYKELEPLSVKIRDLNWWYIPYDETGVRNGFLPYYSQIISSYYPYPMSNRVTTCSFLMKKYGHYIFGIYKEKGEIARFVYGVPGEFKKEEQPYKGVTGFKNWSYSNKESDERHGYWLVFVNPKTGEATEPPQISLA